jgi:hypothetical protein
MTKQDEIRSEVLRHNPIPFTPRTEARLEAACKLALLFHSGSPWDSAKQWEWMKLLSECHDGRPLDWWDASTKVLCNAIRAAIHSP